MRVSRTHLWVASLVRDLRTSEDPTENPDPLIHAIHILSMEAKSALFYAIMDKDFKEVSPLVSLVTWVDFVTRSLDILEENLSSRHGKSVMVGKVAYRALEDVIYEVASVIFGKIA